MHTLSIKIGYESLPDVLASLATLKLRRLQSLELECDLPQKSNLVSLFSVLLGLKLKTLTLKANLSDKDEIFLLKPAKFNKVVTFDTLTLLSDNQDLLLELLSAPF